MSRFVSLYVCPRGVFGVECKPRSGGLEVVKSFDVFAAIDSVHDAVGQVTRALAANAAQRSEVVLAIRGFGAVHHVVSVPESSGAELRAHVESAMQQAEPDLVDPVVAYSRMADATGASAQPHIEVSVAAIPHDVASAVESAVRGAGHRLLHLTALGAGINRLAEEFLQPSETAAIVAQLPDGAYVGFAFAGGIRLAVEPPPSDESQVLAEELELGAELVRQQFRGAEIARAVVIASREAYPDIESAIGARMSLTVSRPPLPPMSAGAAAAFGAMLDAQSQRPTSLAGNAASRNSLSARGLRVALAASLLAAAVAGVWFGGKAVMDRITSAPTAVKTDSQPNRRVATATAPDAAKPRGDSAAPVRSAPPTQSTARDTASPVARDKGVSTVSSGVGRSGKVSAIVIVENRAAAVIDGQVVSVGDTLRGAARVEAIQSNQVTVVERNGRRRVLTLTSGRQ